MKFFQEMQRHFDESDDLVYETLRRLDNFKKDEGGGKGAYL